MNTKAYCACGWTKTLSEFYAGKMVRCPQCNAVVEIARPQTVYQLEVEPSAPASAPAPQAVGVPYAYPPYLSWKRPGTPPAVVVQPWRRPQPQPWVAAGYCGRNIAREQGGDMGACTVSGVLVLAWLLGLLVLGHATHPLVPGLAGLITAILVLRSARNPSSRHTVGVLMLIFGFVMLIGGSLMSQPRRNYGARGSSPQTVQQKAPPSQVLGPARDDEALKKILLPRAPERRAVEKPTPSPDRWVKDYFDRVGELPAPRREMLPLPDHQTAPSPAVDPDDEDEQF